MELLNSRTSSLSAAWESRTQSYGSFPHSPNEVDLLGTDATVHRKWTYYLNYLKFNYKLRAAYISNTLNAFFFVLSSQYHYPVAEARTIERI